ncbi:FAD binding domain-containing protein [Candidatus Marinimicrobia bacterium]|nr:FAD binding domain-containing protein [Candidatus Neomarinimicrobiota bacterium]MDC1037633.1 FAD binding domain-containing protein [Candidatus Neomarinimicrobiota bacterium]
MIEFILNNKTIKTEKPSGSLLLDFVRYDKSLTGTKIGCREGDCGACTVLIGNLKNGQMDYKQVTSCLTPLGNVQGKHVVTIEGLNMESLSPVQQYIVDESGSQCGFCTTGFVVSLTQFCLANSAPSYKDAIASIDGNICRCTGYKPIERAAKHITESLSDKSEKETLDWLITRKFIPSYFKDIPTQLNKLIPVIKTEQNGKLVGGGTDLYVQKMDQLIDHDVNLITEFSEIRFTKVENGICSLGAGNTATDMLESDEMQSMFPNLTDHIKLVASSPIRNIATLGGNFVNASPIGDFTAFFLAINANITLTEDGQDRTIFLKDFYKGYKELDKTPGEFISSISFNVPIANSHFNFEKVSKRIHLDIASVNTAVQISVTDNEINETHLSAGGVGPIPMYLNETSAFLNGKELSALNIKSANDVLQREISPISDVRGSADYKRLLLRQLFYAHFIKLFPNQITLESLK